MAAPTEESEVFRVLSPSCAPRAALDELRNEQARPAAPASPTARLQAEVRGACGR